jgi:hypothetical protein
MAGLLEFVRKHLHKGCKKVGKTVGSANYPEKNAPAISFVI